MYVWWNRAATDGTVARRAFRSRRFASYIIAMKSLEPPYSLASYHFPLTGLAALAGRAQLGGPREAAIAVFLVARLLLGVLPPFGLPTAIRAKRSAGAKVWLASLALPAPVRAALARAAEASGGDDLSAMRATLDKVIEVTARQLDEAAKWELASLSRALAEGKISLALGRFPPILEIDAPRRFFSFEPGHEARRRGDGWIARAGCHSKRLSESG